MYTQSLMSFKEYRVVSMGASIPPYCYMAYALAHGVSSKPSLV